MQKRTKIIAVTAACALVVGIAVAVAGPIVYRDLIAEPPAETPELIAEDGALDAGSGEALDPAALAGDWTVGEGSEAGYRVDEVLNGTDVTVTGRTAEVAGSLTLATAGEGEITLSAAEFRVDVASIATDSSSRDRYFAETALRTDQYPTASFVLTQPVTTAVPASGETVEQELTGDLTIAGVTRGATFTVQLRSDGQTVEAAGQIPIAFADFGVEAPDLGFVSVEDAGYVEFSLVAAPA